MQGVARAGDRLVAVGQRGHIVVSNDGGTTWQQSPVPVSSDLTAVFFVNDKQGLGRRPRRRDPGHAATAARRWALQLDGARANAAIVDDLQRKAAAQPTESPRRCSRRRSATRSRAPTSRSSTCGSTNENDGYVVGAYNLIFRTDDGGKTWKPWFDRTDNPEVSEPVRDPSRGRRAVHRRRGGPRAQARCRRRSGSARSTSRYQGTLLRRRRRRQRGARVRPARQRVSQRRRGQDLDQGRRGPSGDDRRRGGVAQRRDRARRRQRPRRRVARRRHARSQPSPLDAAMHARPASPTRAHGTLALGGRRAASPSRIAARARPDPRRNRPWPSSPTISSRCRWSATLADFDRNSGNLLERLVFNNRAAVLVVCAIAHGGARLRRGDEARAERELREDDSAEPAVHQELPRRTRRTCAASATRCASSSRTPTATSSTRRISRR